MGDSEENIRNMISDLPPDQQGKAREALNRFYEMQNNIQDYLSGEIHQYQLNLGAEDCLFFVSNFHAVVSGALTSMLTNALVDCLTVDEEGLRAIADMIVGEVLKERKEKVPT